MLHNNKFIRILALFFASFGFLVILEMSFQPEYSTAIFRRDLLVALFTVVNTVFITPVVFRFFQKTKA